MIPADDARLIREAVVRRAPREVERVADRLELELVGEETFPEDLSKAIVDALSQEGAEPCLWPLLKLIQDYWEELPSAQQVQVKKSICLAYGRIVDEIGCLLAAEIVGDVDLDDPPSNESFDALVALTRVSTPVGRGIAAHVLGGVLSSHPGCDQEGTAKRRLDMLAEDSDAAVRAEAFDAIRKL